MPLAIRSSSLSANARFRSVALLTRIRRCHFRSRYSCARFRVGIDFPYESLFFQPIVVESPLSWIVYVIGAPVRARTGAPMTYTIHDKGLSTTIGWKNKDSYGKSIPTRNRAQLYRLRKWQRRIRVSNATERNLAFALSELDRMASGMGLPRNVRETAAMVYRKAVNKNLIRGRSIEGVVAASLYAACRQCNVPRTLDEIANSSRVGRKEIGRTYRFMTRELKLKLMPTKPQDYVSRFCSELKLTGE